MGAKVIESRPDFVFVVARRALVALVGNISWSKLVYTLLVPFQVVLGTKAIRFGAIWRWTFVRLGVSKSMLPTIKQLVLNSPRIIMMAYLASEKFLATKSQLGCWQVRGSVPGSTWVSPTGGRTGAYGLSWTMGCIE